MNSRFSRAFLTLLVFLTLLLRNPLLYLLDALILLVIGASALWGRFCLAGVTYARRFSAQRMFYGEALDLWVEIANAKPLPLAWLKVEDDLPLEFEVQRHPMGRSSDPQRQTLTNLLSVRWYELVRRHYRLTAMRRGLFEFGPVVMSSGDIFGFRTRYLDLDCRQKVLVYPRLLPLEELGLQPARPFGESRAIRRVSEDPLRLAGVRDYQPGDGVRRIHWKATARRGALQTRVYEPNASDCLAIFLNSHMLGQAQMTDTFETAVTVAASLAQAGLEARYPVGFFTNGGAQESQYRVRVPASRHPAQSQRLLETLAQLTYFTFLNFERLLEAEAPQLPFGATVIAVSAVVGESILVQLMDLAAAGHPVALIVIGSLPADVPLPPDFPVYTVTEHWQAMSGVHPQRVGL